MKFLVFSQIKLGSSTLSPAHGRAGARATIKNMIAPPKSFRAKPKQAGKKEGGLGEGIFTLLRLKLERFRFSLIKRNTKQKNFLFLLKEKMGRGKIKKCKENFSVLFCRSGAEASGNAPIELSCFSERKISSGHRTKKQAYSGLFFLLGVVDDVRTKIITANPQIGLINFINSCGFF